MSTRPPITRSPSAMDRAVTGWRQQLRNRITCPVELADRLDLPPPQRKLLAAVAGRYPLSITPYYLGLIDPGDRDDPIRRQCVPVAAELADAHRHPEDPFHESTRSTGTGVIQRYANRAVFLVHRDCAVHCRHCTRKNTWTRAGTAAPLDRLNAAVDHIGNTPAIREVILSGGDPLLLETPTLANVLDAFLAIPHVSVIRIGTRVPVTLPMRIDTGLCRMLASRRPLWINTHFNHPREITPLAAKACERLVRSGIPVSNQSVLLRGVNDRFPVLHALCEGLFHMMVRPYYLFDADPVRGTAHFRVPQRRGRALHAQLQASLSGLALPRYAADRDGLPHKRILA